MHWRPLTGVWPFEDDERLMMKKGSFCFVSGNWLALFVLCDVSPLQTVSPGKGRKYPPKAEQAHPTATLLRNKPTKPLSMPNNLVTDEPNGDPDIFFVQCFYARLEVQAHPTATLLRYKRSKPLSTPNNLVTDEPNGDPYIWYKRSKPSSMPIFSSSTTAYGRS